ncbi:MAG: XrtA/PEP-CTERM system-associated ATPase [Nitrospirota bacterium]
MYKSFFKFKTKPFELVPNPAFMYLSRTHRRAMHYLQYGIRERAGFILLTGEVGSGKTTLIFDLIQRLTGNVILAKIFNTKVSSEQLISMINDDFGLAVQGKNKILLLKELNDFLIQQHARNYTPVLIVDEAQNLKPDLLEEIRMLSNLETSTSKLLQILLVGQPELRDVLSKPELRQLRQRISINCRISPLSKEETIEYIMHRLKIAGNQEAVRFANNSIEIIYQYTKGIPRLINIMCDFVLLTACIEETHDVDSEMVQDIVKDLDFEALYWGSPVRPSTNGTTTDYSALLQALGVQNTRTEKASMNAD